ncbi:hypothetical protein K0M31_008273 [Melipona bicolor]|uniref:Uncharacterized protein n=1 Tax=Melipona bicolor TaxID=60889 RepID=A0AA40FR15_9HYME|nr:hypothetical protein K0M31_008273 [Melipona bicolor]
MYRNPPNSINAKDYSNLPLKPSDEHASNLKKKRGPFFTLPSYFTHVEGSVISFQYGVLLAATGLAREYTAREEARNCRASASRAGERRQGALYLFEMPVEGNNGEARANFNRLGHSTLSRATNAVNPSSFPRGRDRHVPLSRQDLFDWASVSEPRYQSVTDSSPPLPLSSTRLALVSTADEDNAFC